MTEGADARLMRHQRIRMRRFGMAIATYAVFLFATLLVISHGIGSFSVRRWALACGSAVVINLGFWLVFRSGANLRFRDPSLTAAQIVASGYWGLIILDGLPEIRPLALMFYNSAFAFGILQLSTRQYLKVSAILLAGYAAMLINELWIDRPDMNLSYELLIMALFGIVLVWYSVFGGFVSHLRVQLKARTLALEEANRRIRHQAVTDDLTDIPNRRHAIESLKRMSALAERLGICFSVALIDIDHFKHVNDRYGHAVGDEVLRSIAQRLGALLREADLVFAGPPASEPDSLPMVARYGGEEFLVLLPGTALEDAHRCLDRIRETLGVSASGHKVTFSAGLAECRGGESLDLLLIRADRALYAAKEGGRDRVCIARIGQ